MDACSPAAMLSTWHLARTSIASARPAAVGGRLVGGGWAVGRAGGRVASYDRPQRVDYRNTNSEFQNIFGDICLQTGAKVMCIM